MPQPVSYNPGTPVSGSIQENNISYVVDGQQRNYRGGFGGLSWMSEVPAENNVIFIGNSTSLGRGPANIPLFYPAYNNSAANIVYAANTLPGSPRNFTTTGSAYNWAVTNNFFINNSNNPIPRIDADGLVLYVDANQPSSYPQINNTWYDLSGQNNVTNLLNGPAWNSNGWIVFDSTDDYADTSVNTNALFSSNDPFSVSITIKPTETINANSGLVTNQKYQSEVSPGGFGLVTYNANQVAINLTKNDGTGTVSYEALAPTTLSINSWQNITYTYDPGAGTVTGYKNGTLANSSTSAAYKWTPEARVSWIGRNWQGGWSNDFFSSEISNVSIYRKTLSQSEIKQNYFQSNIVQDGLVFMVDANNLVSYPKSGTAWYNLTGSVASGSLINGPTFSPSNGGLIVFDGIDDYVQLNGTVSLNVWTITTNLFYNYQNKTFEFFLGNSASGAEGKILLSYAGQVSFRNSNYYNFSKNSSELSNKFSNLSFVSNGTSISLYVDGVFNSSVTPPSTNIPLNTIGNAWSDLVWLSSFKLGDLCMYDRALTPSEIQQNYQATKDKFQGQQIITNGLVLNLDAANKDSYPGTGTTWYDLSGNGNNGTINSGEFIPNSFGGYLGNLNNQSNFFYISIPNSTSISNTLSVTTGGWTIEEIIWTNSTDYPEADAGSVFSNPAYGPAATGFDWNHGFGINQFRFGQSSNSATGYEDDVIISSIPSQYAQFNTWRIRTMIWDRSNNTVSLYINGVYIGGGSTPNTAGQPIYDGDGGDVGALYGWKFYGRRGAFKIWNKVLSQSEITQNYNAQKTRFGL
jgi:hypothetical protein